jgi:hypothetical protein
MRSPIPVAVKIHAAQAGFTLAADDGSQPPP